MYCVYLIKYKRKAVKIYIGYTNNFQRRFLEHVSNKGALCLRNAKILGHCIHSTWRTCGEAMREEKRLKKLTKKQKRETFELIKKCCSKPS